MTRATPPAIDELLPSLEESEPEPWIEETEIEVAGIEGIRSSAGERARIARKRHVERVEGAMDEEGEQGYESVVSGDESVRIDGEDRLTVEGGADIRIDERRVLMRGTFERRWTGAITRMSAIEGVIAGGSFTRVQAGPCVALMAFGTSDVYGGASRLTGVRTQVSGTQYQTSRGTARAAGLYVRSAGVVVEPLTWSPAAEPPARTMRAKAARIGMIAGSMIPFFGIATTVVTIPVGIARLIRSARRGRPPPGTQGAPRMRMRNGMRVLNGGIEIIL